MILISDNCNCGETCVGGLTCHCNDQTTYICPDGNCSIPNNGNCGCSCCPSDTTLPETHRVQRLIAPSRDTHTNWNDKDPVIKEGVLGFTKDRVFNGSLEYFIGDGVHKYSELMKYAAAPASTSNDPNTLVLRDANGDIGLPDATPTTKGVVKASTTKAADNAVKSDANGGLSGWKDAISDAVANPDAGLVKNSDGTLGVDFDQMPTDKFEALLKSLKMLIPLETNLNLYVNKGHTSAGDTIINNRGTQNLPFKTIQAAVNYVTQTYAIGTHTVTIYISSDTYTENVRLPEYSRTTGAIRLQSVDFSNPATITNASSSGSVIAVTGSYWYLRNLNLVGSFSDPNNGRRNYSYVVSCSDATVNIGGCALTGTYNGAAPVLYMRMDLASVMGVGTIAFSVVEGYHNSFTCNKGNANTANVIAAENKATVSFGGGNATDDGIMYDYPCSGVADTFIVATNNSNVSPAGGSLHLPTFSVNGTFTGERYRALNGSGIVSLAGGFPGSGDPDEGTVESTTFSWYKHTAAS